MQSLTFKRDLAMLIGIGLVGVLGAGGASVRAENDRELLPIEQDTFVYDDHGAPDPFVPFWVTRAEEIVVVPVEEQLQERMNRISVNGILWDPSRPLVMINNKIYQVGDVVEEVEVAAINSNTVIFAYKGATQEIAIITKDDLDGQGGTDAK